MERARRKEERGRVISELLRLPAVRTFLLQ